MTGSVENSAELVAVFDLDGTITFSDTYVEFLIFCLKKRPLKIFRGFELIVFLMAHKAGLKSNHWLKEKYLETVAGGLGGHALQAICEEFCLQTVSGNFKPKALAELRRLKNEGYTLVLATASFDFYVDSLFSALKMDYLLCSKAMLDGEGALTGALDGRNCIGAEKANRLQQLCLEQGWQEVDLAYSDHIVDLPLFQMANTAVVIDPKPATALKAADLGYRVEAWR